MAMQVVDEKWYLYLGHLYGGGWAIVIVEVTAPSKPEYIKFIPGPANTSTGQVQVADGIMVTALENAQRLEGLLGLEKKQIQPFEEGIYIWDVKDPVNPERLGHFRTGANGTHRNHLEGGRYVHLAANARGFDGLIYRSVDILDPSRPVEVGRWWLPEQWAAGGAKLTKRRVGGEFICLYSVGQGFSLAMPRESGTLRYIVYFDVNNILFSSMTPNSSR